LSARSTDAASELPPPSPAPSGIALSSAIATPRRQPVASLSLRAARSARSSPAGTPGTSRRRTTSPSSRASSVTVSARSTSVNSDSSVW
jgi:hypothetical protein